MITSQSRTNNKKTKKKLLSNANPICITKEKTHTHTLQ